ncbi:MAG: hypothetical protein CMJ78_04135 [Planctomycetaceae bacterium]|nr:hypothetical protein [Planctomycetaceae bacterium]
MAGCAALPTLKAPVSAANPLFVPGTNQEAIWERTIDVLHSFNFEIARENRLDGEIETQYKIGASLIEPWQHDSVGFENRLESTLQSVRRRCFVHIRPVDGGFLVGVEVFKELEDIPRSPASARGDNFRESSPVARNVEPTRLPEKTSWLNLGRDPLLEQSVLATLARGA